MTNSKKLTTAISLILFIGITVFITGCFNIGSFSKTTVKQNKINGEQTKRISPEEPTTNPIISWTSDSINRSIPQGEREFVPASFTSNEDLNKVEVWITPEIKPYLTASPTNTNFGSINKNTSYNLILLFSIPPDAPANIYKGTLYIRNKDNTAEDYSNPLAINLEIIPAGTSTPEDTIEKATAALDNQDIDGFLLYVAPYKQKSMKERLEKLIQLGQAGQIAIQQLSNSIKNAVIVEQTDDYAKLENKLSVPPDGAIKVIYFEMVFSDGAWKISSL